MTLQRRVIRTIAALTLGLVVLVGTLTSVVMLRGFRAVESSIARENAERAAHAVEARVESLSNKLLPWSNWDDSYRFIQDLNAEYAQSNLQYESLEYLGLSAIIFLDSTGRLRHGAEMDPRTRTVGPLASDLTELLQQSAEEGSPVFRALAEDESVAGLYVRQGRPYLLAARPILTSHGKGPTPGSIVFVRPLDPPMIQQLAEQVNLRLATWVIQGQAPADAEARAALEQIRAAELTGAEGPVRIIDGESVGAYSLVPGLIETTGMLVRADSHRWVSAQA